MLDFWEKTIRAFWRFMPALTILLLIALSTVPLRLPGLSNFMPLMPLAGLFYWTMYKPELLPYWGVFALGLVQDSMQGTPLGISSLIFLSLRLLMEVLRRLFRRETFASIWIAFLLVSFFTSLAYWLILCLYHGQWLGIVDVALQWLFTLLFYPAAHYLLNRLYYALPEAIRHA